MHDVNPELLYELRRNAQSSEPPARGSPRRPCDRAEAGRGAGTRRRSHPRIRQGDQIPTAGTTRPMRDLVAVDVEIDRWIVGRERAEHTCQLRILVKGRCMVPARSPAHALS